LLAVPVLALDQVPNTSRRLVLAALPTKGKNYPGTAALLRARVDLAGLPFLMGKDCHLSKEEAGELSTQAANLHRHLGTSTKPSDETGITTGQRLKALLEQNDGWGEVQCLSAVSQILQAEDRSMREVLVELVDGMEGPRATATLVKRALFDVSAEVRQAAVRALAKRPAEELRRLLLAGLRYPWPPAAAHAAEALVALGETEAVPALKVLLDQPPPGAPQEVIADLPSSVAVRELVRVNHLGNCLLCHAPSLDAKDLVRGLIPTPGVAPRSGAAYYNGGPNDLFVRADVTYLRQDFSLPQPVASPPKEWPKVQRFDYLVRVRPATDADIHQAAPLQEERTRTYREALLFALRELSQRKS
jgi:hypothetical protein